METIKEFRGEYRFLSNFYPCRVKAFGLIFPSVENAYQASKCKYMEDMEQFLNIMPSEAKRLGRTVPLAPFWESTKITTMGILLRRKFAIPELRIKLLDTGDKILQEGNTWHDTFWGVDIKTSIGQNILGKLLMQIRTELYDSTQNSI